jgi:predicted methyltransferase
MKACAPLSALLLGVLLAAPAASHDHDALAKAIAGAHRAEANVARDAVRHPQQTLEFFGFQPGLTIIEVSPGGGWYTEILAPAVRGSGKLIAAHFPADSASEYMQRVRGEFLAMLAAAPEVFDQVEVTGYSPGIDGGLGAAGSADLVMSFRNLHGYHRAGVLDSFFADAFAVLKDGGTLGIVQHRAPAGADPEAGKQSGYLPQDWVIARAEAAGFRLAGSAEINANPRDTADHPGGVWALPPTLRHGEQDREKYLAIGESDRMTLRFVKPGA